MPDLPSAFLRPFPASEIFHRRFVARIPVWCRLVAFRLGFRSGSMNPSSTKRERSPALVSFEIREVNQITIQKVRTF